jgi:CubicO group peptidase (beta-lactamase class C family)
MKKLACVIFLFFLGHQFVLAQQKLKELENIISDSGVSGIQLVYTSNGETKAYNAGVDKDGSAKKITSKTIFKAGSLGKCVFAYEVLRLYDRGLVALDTPLLHYIGTYKRFKSNDPQFAKITARMVLSHTSGLPNFKDTSRITLLFTPGSAFSYSGEGIWFLQKVVEKLLNKQLEDIMQEDVFGPLKMKNSTYIRNNKMDPAMLGVDPKVMDFFNPNAAASLYTNADDYNIFLQALVHGKGLKPATQQLMFSKQSDAQWFGRDTSKADTYIDWGLGVGLQQNEKGKAIWHWGNVGNEFLSFYIAFPDGKQSLIYFTHSLAGLKIANEIVSLFLGRQTTWATQWGHWNYEQPATMIKLHEMIRKQGFEHTAAIFKKLKSSGYQFSEGDLNFYGYVLLKQNKAKQAYGIFQQVTQVFPKSSNAYDSFAEVCEDIGNKELAIKNYKYSLVLDTANINAVYHIKELENKENFKEEQLKAFEGKYKRADNEGSFLQFKASGNRLRLKQSWDGNEIDCFHIEKLEFYNSAIGILIKFLKDDSGKISKVIAGSAWVKVQE